MQTGDGGVTPGRGPRTGESGSRLDHWLDSYAARTRGMTASEIRALFAVASRYDVVLVAEYTGNESPHLGVVFDYQRVTARAASRQDADTRADGGVLGGFGFGIHG